MLGIIMLLGLGVVASAVSIGGGDDDDETVEATPEQDDAGPTLGTGPDLPDLTDTPRTLGDADDTIIASEFFDDYERTLDQLVAEGELSDVQKTVILGFTNFEPGTLNLDMAGGDDYVLAGSGDDTLLTGSGEDDAFGGLGDDRIELGAGSDTSGIDFRVADREDDMEPFPISDANGIDEIRLEGGDDTILGGGGVDYIADGYGENRLNGQQGNDFIISVDQDALSPDRVLGGAGDDVLIVDQGDLVTGNNGEDRFTVDVFDGVADGYQVVEITDFMPGQDILELEGNPAELRTPEPSGPDDVVTNPIAVREVLDGTAAPDGSATVLGTMVSVSGIDTVFLRDVAGLQVEDILIST